MTDTPAEQKTASSAPERSPQLQGILDIPGLFRVMRRRRGLTLAATAGALALALAYILFVPPKYAADVVILSDPRQQNVLTTEAVLTGIGADTAAVESQVELIQSTELAQRIIDDLELAKDPEFNRVGTIERITSLVRSSEPTEADTEKVRRRIVDTFLKQLNVRRRGLTYIIEVNFYSRDPQKAARIANAVADAYLRDQRTIKYDATADASDWLEDRTAELRDAVRASDQAVNDFKAAHDILDVGSIGSGETLNLRETEEVNRLLIAARARTAEAKAKHQQVLEASRPGGNPAALSAALESRVLQDLRAQNAVISRREAQLSAQLKSKHPSLALVRAQLDSSRDAIQAELKRIAQNAKIEHDVARDYQQSLEKRLGELQKSAKVMNEQKVRLAELERDQQANRRLYEQVVARGKETREQTSLQKADARIVARATPPIKPSGPGVPLILVIASIGGLGLGSMMSFFAEALDQTYRTGDALAKDIGRRCLGLLPRTSGTLLPTARRGPPAAFTDEIGAILRKAVARSADDLGTTLLVTSALPGEGKTVVAANLAREIATHDAHALLVTDTDTTLAIAHDGALDAGSLEKSAAGVAEKPGLYVLDRAALERSLPLKSGAGYTASVAALAPHFDVIIVDGHAVLSGRDGAEEAIGADSVLLVVAWGETAKGSIAAALDALDAVGAKLIGSVLNKVDMKSLRLYDPDRFN